MTTLSTDKTSRCRSRCCCYRTLTAFLSHPQSQFTLVFPDQSYDFMIDYQFESLRQKMPGIFL